MARIVDFNINTAKTIPTNTNSCSVVINNVKNTGGTTENRNQSQFPQQVVYPEIPNEQFQSVAPSFMTRTTNVDTNNVNLENLYKLLAITFSNILKDNNAKLIANIIDNSGKIIVDASNLIRIIALITNSMEGDIHIEYVNKDKEGGCTGMSKINPIKQIENIKIGYVDFKLGYNDKYNILADTFNISLKKCIIPISYGF